MIEVCRCPRCKSELSADAPEGLCPECLLQQALRGPAAGPDQEEKGRSPAPGFIPPTPAELARHFPQLEILKLLGQGGMGAVYKARQPKLDRLIAVKVLPPEVARDPAFADRFTREAMSLARLNHPNIVTIYDFGETNGLYYFSMEYVDGKNVRELLEAGELPSSLALKIVPQVCDALQYAHEEGIVHRDIKPENILLDRKGRVKIADFGLAKLVGLTPTYLTLTGSHEVMGTLYYMAPEQLKRSHLVDHRADLYSLGVVFYEMLTGELPLGRFAPPSHKARIDERLDAIVHRALAREPEHRYQDAGELKKEVENLSTRGLAAHNDAQRAASPAPAGLRGTWPIVRFTIPGTNWAGGKAQGEIYRDEESLILEFQEFRFFKWTETNEVKIPFSEITSISCQTESWPRKHGFAKLMRKHARTKKGRLADWLSHWGLTQLVIKTVRPDVLAGLPTGKHGKGRLLVHWGDQEAAQELVDSIVQPHLKVPEGDHWPRAGDDHRGQVNDPEKIRMEVAAPATGLLLAGVIGVLSSIAVWVVAISLMVYRTEIPAYIPGLWMLAALPVGVMSCYLLIGAIRMMKLQSYSFAVAASIVAMVPWSPGWLLGLPFGIWALVVLCKGRVIQAFLNRPEEAPAGGRVLSFFRSVGRYFLPTFAGRAPTPDLRADDISGAAPPNRAPQPHPTVDFPAGPLARKADVE